MLRNDDDRAKAMIETNKSLKSYNTFGIESIARYFFTVNHVEELQVILSHAKEKNTHPLMLGGGSNILLTKDFDGLVLHNKIMGIEKINEDAEHVYLKVGAGENWHQFVLYCIEQHYAGIENLSLIPGTVGAAPIQNIGAYGVEIKDTVFEVHTISIDDQSVHVFTNHACDFNYRDSIFKRTLKNKLVITHVVFRLNKTPAFQIDYGSIKQKLQGEDISIKRISDTIIQLRQEKLPNPALIGNAGSFFKNPIVSEDIFLNMQKKYSSMPYFKEKDDRIKIPAAWLIEQCGFKGKRFGDVGIHANQALVLVNYGNGSGEQIKQLSTTIQTAVKETFVIDLVTEVHII